MYYVNFVLNISKSLHNYMKFFNYFISLYMFFNSYVQVLELFTTKDNFCSI